MTECSEEMQYCFASSCALENVVLLAWDCIAHANCDATNKNYGKGLNLTSSPCRCQFGAKGVDWGNENLTFSPAASVTITPPANFGFCPIPTFCAVLMAALGIAISFYANIVGYGFSAA
uniref:Transmembrane protein n=1 Tax=Globodera pallida TaxID=36090 RepID=A0A183CEK4_GLOPA